MANSSSNNSSSGASSMAELMAKHQTPVVSLKKGEMVKGKITKLTKNEIRVDLHSKSQALAIEKDRNLLRMMLDTLQVGDEIEAKVITTESEAGYALISMRQFLHDRMWTELERLQKSKEQIDVTVTESTKGGYVVLTDTGMSGFLPNSHTAFTNGQQVNVGQKIAVSVIDLNRKDNKIIFSQKSTFSDEDFKHIKAALKTGEKVHAPITNVTQFGIFVALVVPGEKEMTVDGLIHISELSWDREESVIQNYQVGETIEAVIIGFDTNAKRVDLSIKRLTEDPFSAIAKKFPVDTKVSATVIRLTELGVVVDLDGAEGLVRKEKLPPTVSFQPGDTVTLTVSDIDTRHRRILLVPVLLEKPMGYR